MWYRNVFPEIYRFQFLDYSSIRKINCWTKLRNSQKKAHLGTCSWQILRGISPITIQISFSLTLFIPGSQFSTVISASQSFNPITISKYQQSISECTPSEKPCSQFSSPFLLQLEKEGGTNLRVTSARWWNNKSPARIHQSAIIIWQLSLDKSAFLRASGSRQETMKFQWSSSPKEDFLRSHAHAQVADLPTIVKQSQPLWTWLQHHLAWPCLHHHRQETQQESYLLVSWVTGQLTFVLAIDIKSSMT